jgi:3',5'-cyclic AMP phosphodiesterase CpdA
LYEIAHISDTHITNNSLKHIDIFGKLLESISINKCDHLIITGDIGDSSRKEDYTIIRKYLKKYNYLNSSKLSVTIGNHDIFGGAQRGDNVFLFPDTCKKTDYYLKVNDFINYFSESFKKTVISDNKRIFPYYKILYDNIALIGINSIALWSVDENPTASNGNIDEINFDEIQKILSLSEIQKRIKIVLIHHQFYEPDLNAADKQHHLWLYSERNTMKLHRKDRIINLFGKYGVDLILHGHSHLTHTYFINKNLYINSSGCTVPFSQIKKCSYNIISFPGNRKNKFIVKKIHIKI